MDVQSDYHVLVQSIIDESKQLVYCEGDMNFMKQHDLSNHYLTRCESQLAFLTERINHMLKYQKTVNYLEELTNAFIEHDIKVIFLKGISIAESYPHNSSRMPGDCELLICSHDLPRLQMILVGMGYLPNCDDYSNEDDTERMSITFFSKVACLNITLYLMPIRAHSPIESQLFEQIYENPVKLALEGFELTVPAPELHYIYIVNDIQKAHSYFPIGIKQLMDLVYFSNAHKIRHREAHQVHQAFGCGDFHRMLVSVCHHVLLMPVQDSEWLIDKDDEALKGFWQQICQMKAHNGHRI